MSWVTWLCITLFYCYQYVLRVLPNIINNDIMSGFNIGAAEFGSFAGIYYIGYIVLHIPLGVIISKVGARIVLPVCIVLTAIGLAPLVYPLGWNGALIGRFLTGIGSSASVVGALQIFRILYPGKFGRMLGIMVSCGLITVVYSGKPIATVIGAIGITATINILLYSGLALAVLTYFLMPKETEEVSETSILADIKAVVLNYRIIFTGLCSGLMVGAVEGFADAWGSSFLNSVYGIDKVLASSITFVIFLGMSVGCVVLPYIADKTHYYFGVTIAAGIGMVLCFAYILGGDASVTGLNYICFIIGVFSGYQIVVLTKVTTFVSEERSGIAGAMTNMIVMAFGWFFHNSIGITLDSSWDGAIIDGVKQYSSEAFTRSISIIPFSTIVAIFGLSGIAMTTVIRARAMKGTR